MIYVTIEWLSVLNNVHKYIRESQVTNAYSQYDLRKWAWTYYVLFRYIKHNQLKKWGFLIRERSELLSNGECHFR